MNDETLLPDETEISSDSSKNATQPTVWNQTEEKFPQSLKEAEQEVAEEWRIGDVILDTYEVKEIFTGGAMGLVYRVYHNSWNTDLVVKAPRANHFQTEIQKENFKREAETWINLGLHPNIVNCYYVRELGGVPRVFAEYIKEGTLKDWIGEEGKGKLYEDGKEKSLERILDFAIQFAWGLNYAHEQGLVHQDIKPANILITDNGTVKVTDFGLARARGVSEIEPENNLSTAGQSILVASGGMTPAYASPEQASGKALSRKTDIWSWGLTVLEMFVGERTWMSGETAPGILESFQDNGSEYTQIPAMPKQLAELLNKCFTNEPAHRPKDMLVVADELQQVYQNLTQTKYKREIPKAAKLQADSLNNKAASLIDLGRKDEALKLWDEILKIHPQHPESTYNRGLILWRTAQLGDDDLVREMEEVQKSHQHNQEIKYLLGQIHLERDDMESAIEAFNGISELDGRKKEIADLLSFATSRNPNSKRLLNTFEGHTKLVTSVSLSAKGKYAVSGSEDNTLKLWDTETGKCLRTFEGHVKNANPYFSTPGSAVFTAKNVTSANLSADAKYALSGSWDYTLKLWEIATGKCLRTFEGHKERVDAVSASSDFKFALSGSLDGTLKFWDVATGNCLQTLEDHTKSVYSLSLSSNGKYALSGSADNTLKLWDTATGKCLKTIEGEAIVRSISLSSDGKYALFSFDNALNFYDITSGECLQTFKGHTATIHSVSLSSDGKYALSGSGEPHRTDNDLKLWEIATGRCLRTFEGHKDMINAVSFSADGKCAVSGAGYFDNNKDNTVKIWAICPSQYSAPLTLCRFVESEAAAKAEIIFEENLTKAEEFFSNSNFVSSIDYIKQARSQRGYERNNEALELWTKLYTYLPHKAFNGGWSKAAFLGHTDAVSSIDCSIDGKYLLSGSVDKTLKLWEIATGKCLRTFEGHNGLIQSVGLSSDGKYALSGAAHDNNDDNTLKLWDVSTGECLRTFEGHRDSVRSVSFSLDGKFALSGSSDKTIKLWNVKTRQCLRTLVGHTDYIQSVGFSADGKYVLSASSDHTIKLWDIVTSKCLRTFTGHKDSVNSMSLSADGKYALTASTDKTIKLWNISDFAYGGSLRTFEGHKDRVTSVSFSADGKYGLSGSPDNTVKLWDIQTGKCLHTFERLSGYNNKVVLSPDGKYAFSGGNYDSEIKVWLLEWELEDRQPVDWDENASAHLKKFLTFQTPYAVQLPTDRAPTKKEITLALIKKATLQDSAFFRYPLSVAIRLASTKRQNPQWTDKDFENLRYKLGCAGYGYINSEGVKNELSKMVEIEAKAASRKKTKRYIGALASIVLILSIIGAINYVRNIKPPVIPVTKATLKQNDSSIPIDINAYKSGNFTFRTNSFEISPDKTLIAFLKTAFSEKEQSEGKRKIYIFNAQSKKINTILKFDADDEYDNSNKFDHVAFSSDNRMLIATSIRNDKYYGGNELKNCKINSFDLQTGKEIKMDSSQFAEKITAFSFSPDGRSFVAGNEKKLQSWNLNTGAILWSSEIRGSPNLIKFSPDSSTVAALENSYGIDSVYETATGKLIFTIGSYGNKITDFDIKSIAFSPDNSSIAALELNKVLGTSNKRASFIRVYELKTGKLLKTFSSGNANDIYQGTGIVFSPDGTKIIANIGDKIVHIFDVKKEVEVLKTDELSGEIKNMSFSSNDWLQVKLKNSTTNKDEIWEVSIAP